MKLVIRSAQWAVTVNGTSLVGIGGSIARMPACGCLQHMNSLLLRILCVSKHSSLSVLIEITFACAPLMNVFVRGLHRNHGVAVYPVRPVDGHS